MELVRNGPLGLLGHYSRRIQHSQIEELQPSVVVRHAT
jgi:hypothetical protein